MGSFSFKSSGITTSTTPSGQIVTTPIPVGIATPLALGDTDLLRVNFIVADQVADNLRNLIQTNWGERLGLYDFGANLRPLLTDIVSTDDFDSAVIERIKVAVQRWMPYIDLVDFLSSFDQSSKITKGTAQVTLTITYNIVSLNVTGKKIVVTLCCM
jgi:phage baseplate assembly protein W